jgi:cap2 methyltransferase
MAALGFTKLPPLPFKKWLISAIDTIKVEDLTPVPTAASNELITLEPAQENSWFALKDKLNAAKDKLNEIPEGLFYNLTNKLDMYATLRNLVQKTYNMEHATNAALKMYEMIYQLELLMPNGQCLPAVNVFCNAELPGAFVIAINHFMRTKCVSSDFDWVASSYLPAAAMQAGDKTILEDKYKIYEKNRLHWLMGPAPNALPEGETPVTGDVTDPAVINTLGNATHQRFSASDGANLYTSDVGIEIDKADLNRQEELTAFVNYGQVLTGLLSLALGGTLITKQFTFYTPFSRSLIAIVASLFDETYIIKPKTSRPTNSEVYLVGKGFKGISSELATALLDRAEAYKTLDKLPTTWGSLLQPNILAQADADILAAAEEVHGEQQVAFLHEIAEAYRVKDFTNTYEKSAQEAWLKENPLLVISRDENLNNAQITVEQQAQTIALKQVQAQQQGEQQALQPIQLTRQALMPLTPELQEESILIPDEDGDGEGEKEGGGTDGSEDNNQSGGSDDAFGGDSNKKIIIIKN